MTEIKYWVIGIVSGAMFIFGVAGLNNAQKAEQQLQRFKEQPHVIQAKELEACKENLHLYKTEITALQDDIVEQGKTYKEALREEEETRRVYGDALQVCSQKLRNKGVVK